MKVGDLVICASVTGRPTGLIVQRFASPGLKRNGVFIVLLAHDSRSVSAVFQQKQLEVISESR